MNLQLPISPSQLIQGVKLNTISVEESIYRHLYLILETSMGQYRYNPAFGCSLWEDDFSVAVSGLSWSTEMVMKIKENISENENRLKPDMKIDVKTIKLDDEDQLNARQHFSIELSNLVISETNEKIADMEYSIVFSPLTIR